MFVSIRRPESLSLPLAVLASLSEVIMYQGSLEESVPKVRDVVTEWVGIRIQMSSRRNTCVIRDSSVTVDSRPLEHGRLRLGQLSEELMFTCQELASKSSNHEASRTFAFPSNFLSLASCFSGIDSEYGFPDFKMW